VIVVFQSALQGIGNPFHASNLKVNDLIKKTNSPTLKTLKEFPAAFEGDMEV